MYSIKFLCSVLLITLEQLALSHKTITHRNPRSLVYIDGGTYKLNLGMTVPVALPKNILQWTFNYQFQFTLPDNATELTPYYYARSLSHPNKRSLSGGSNMAERSRDVLATPEEDHGIDKGDFEGSKDIAHRGAVYRSLEAALDRLGLNGRACVLRSICESVRTPLHHNGLFGELLHVILTPDYGSSSVNLLDEDYLLAQDAGENYWTSCQQKFPECPPGQGLLDLISLIEQ